MIVNQTRKQSHSKNRIEKKKHLPHICLIFLFCLTTLGFPQADKKIAVSYAKAKKYYQEGMNLVKKGKLDLAQEKFLESIETDENFAESYAELGNIYMKKFLFDEAIKKYEESMEAYLRLDAYVSKSIIDRTASSRERDVYSRELYKDLHDKKFVVPPKIYLFLGGAYFRKNMMREALEQFNKAVELDPEYGNAHNNLAVAYFLMKNYDLAWKYLRLTEKFGAKLNPKFIEDLKKAYPEPKINKENKDS